MKSFLIVAASLGLASAAQQLDVAAVLAAPQPAVTEAPVGAESQGDIVYIPDPSSISDSVEPTAAPADASRLFKRTGGGNCAPQPAGTAPNTWPDTPEAFLKNPFYQIQANKWPRFIPSGNSFYFEKFRNLKGSTQQNSYLTYFILDKYDVSACAKKCDSVELCTAFNIYVERSPSLDAGPACPNPKSVAYYKCALWGSSISAETATNTGQFREKFRVVISASNGYEKTNWTPPQPFPGFEIAQNLSGKAITLAKNSFYLGAEFFAGPYDPSLCGYYATAQTMANKAHALQKGLKTYQPCNLFNAYTVYKNKIAQGTYCALFNKVVGAEATGNPGTHFGGDHYDVGVSYTYALSPQDSGRL